MVFGLSAGGARVNTFRLQSEFRQPEIENFCLNSIRDKDVCWLDVPMNDTFRMCGVQGSRDLDAQIEHRLNFQGFACDLVPERLPLQQFHCDEASPIRLVNFVDRADMLV